MLEEAHSVNVAGLFNIADGFVQLKAIIEHYQAQYNWSEEELTAALDNNEDYEFKHDDTHGLLVKAAEKVTSL